jgi:hypothetical protein
MKSSISALILVALAAGCAEQANPDVSFQFRETSLRQLQGVEIGMPAKALRTSRPATKFEPAGGLREIIPGYTVLYKFRSAAEDGATDVAPGDKLLAVFMTRPFDSFEAATSEWREQVRALARSKRIPDLCEGFASGGMQARWLSTNQNLLIGVFPSPASAAQIPPRTLLALGRLEAINQPAGAKPVACPTT